ncbi:hypothetical protein KKF82_09180 [Patescibacteria group bacterium]|nr:hypothetical protein [Patescibacteria group bacterium]
MAEYREIQDDKILEFSATPGFKGWKQFFTDESITHPAKMNLNLLRWILENYTEPGEVVLDPMAGTGSTIILATLMGRHGIAVEYEPRFCDMIRANMELTERQTTLTPKGRMTCIHGDARELSKLLSGMDTIITSPPYADTKRGGEADDDAMAERWDKTAKEREWNTWGKTWKTEGRKRALKSLGSGYSESGENIGNKPYGDIDSIITSPPFGPSTKGGGIFKEGYKAPGEKEVSDPGLPQRHARPLSDDPKNIDNLPYGEAVDNIITSPPYSEGTGHGGPSSDKIAREKRLFLRGAGSYTKTVDAVVTSPPYEGSVPAYDEKWLEEHWDDDSDSPAHKTMRFGRSMKGYPKEVDNVITSPPYEQSLSHRGQDYEEVRKKLLTQGYSEEYIKASWNQPNQCQHWAEEAYGDDSGNIGNLKSETYLEAMIQVYRECWKVLKQSGKLILITKNFIRDKQVVRLDLDTIRLCEAAGFKLTDRWYFKLPTRSFWRILYKKRFPHVPEIDYEDIMIFSKAEDIVNKKDR